MRRVDVTHELSDFRAAARALVAEGVPPDQVTFVEPDDAGHTGELFAADLPAVPAYSAPTFSVPRAYLELATNVAAHRSPTRWGLLYDALFRLTHRSPKLLEDPTDATVLALSRMEKSVLRDVHKTHAFVRFRRLEKDGVEHYIAWHEPEHRTLALAVPHFVRRFASMRWSILTPDATASWDLHTLALGRGVPRSEAPRSDDLEELWRAYYASIFNPARLNLRAMRAELPQRHWHNLPEAELITPLLRSAPRRTGKMTRAATPSPSASLVPAVGELRAVAGAARQCQLCPWAAGSTQTVFGEGPTDARIMLVGEQPGDSEDLAGRPFVGPAGQVLDELLAEAGIPRSACYVTNAVKHFKYERNGKKRIHQKPGTEDIHACRGWLEAELQAVKPHIIVALGATAGQAFLGPTFRLTRSRGEFLHTPWTSHWLATYHPSALLRMPDEAARQRARALCAEDLAKVAAAYRELEQPRSA